jgi:hypothetical protein
VELVGAVWDDGGLGGEAEIKDRSEVATLAHTCDG